MIADVVIGLQYGDEGKGKVTHQLARNGNYSHVLRFNGGCNAGHTIYHEGEKIITHHIPCGVFFGIRSIIGPGCVVNVKKLMSEIKYLEGFGIDARKYLRIASNVHVITDFHIAEDRKDEDIGTTKTGNGPAYRDKYARKGVLAMEIPELSDFIIDIFTEFHANEEFDNISVLCEGAQGFALDIDWGNYPYVTSSHCNVAGIMSSGIPHDAIRDVWGVAKVYETYVGARNFEIDDDAAEIIRESGEEYGATTGRPRQVSWLDLDLLERSVSVNSVNKLVFNKMDILEDVGIFKVFEGESVWEFNSSESMEQYILDKFDKENRLIVFSRSPEEI